MLPRNIMKPSASVRKRKKSETREKENDVPNDSGEEYVLPININQHRTRAGRLVQRRTITDL